MSEPIVIHGIPGSPYVRKPLLVCEEKGAPYRLAAMAFGTGANKTPDYLAKNPFGRIPLAKRAWILLYVRTGISLESWLAGAINH